MRKRTGQREKKSINLCPGCRLCRGETSSRMNHMFTLTSRQTHTNNLSPHLRSHMATGCALVSPVIRIYLSFQRGERQRVQKMREAERTAGVRDKRGGGEMISGIFYVISSCSPTSLFICQFISTYSFLLLICFIKQKTLYLFCDFCSFFIFFLGNCFLSFSIVYFLFF